MAKQVIVWQCEHCGRKMGKSKTWIQKHEAQCMKNPESKNCYKCKYLANRHESLYCMKGLSNGTSYAALTCENYESTN